MYTETSQQVSCLYTLATTTAACLRKGLSLSRHRLRHVVHSADLIRFLTQSAWGAAARVEQISEEAATDALLLSDLTAHLRSADPVENRHEHGQTTEAAVLTDLLGNFTGDDAWTTPNTDQRIAVVTTSAQTMLPITRHSC